MSQHFQQFRWYSIKW